MVDQRKNKTKAAILRELESIKGLLLEEDDIPLLQEVIDTAEGQAGDEAPLDGDDLADLQQTYLDLLLAKESLQEQTPDGSEADSHSHKRTKPEAQASLFDVDTSLPSSSDKPQGRKPESSSRRSSVTRANGENPFLPAHIRERLHGNRPPPLFEPSPRTKVKPSPLTQNAKTAKGAGKETLGRSQLIDDLVASVMPAMEAELRKRLSALSKEQLSDLQREENEDMAPDK